MRGVGDALARRASPGAQRSAGHGVHGRRPRTWTDRPHVHGGPAPPARVRRIEGQGANNCSTARTGRSRAAPASGSAPRAGGDRRSAHRGRKGARTRRGSGSRSSSVRRFLVRRKTSIVKTRLKRSAEYVTPQRIGGRVTPTKRISAVRPALRSLMDSTPRTCRAPR